MMNGRAASSKESIRAWQKGGAGCLLLLFVLLVSTPVLFAQESYREFERGLNLSDSQRAQVEEIKKKYMEEWIAMKNESARKRLELKDLGRSRPDERERSEKLQRDLDQLEASRNNLLRRYRGEVSTVFNDEQKGRFNRFMDSRENRRPMNRMNHR
jgi:Spy/CpxP family protein refolding chaperone